MLTIIYPHYATPSGYLSDLYLHYCNDYDEPACYKTGRMHSVRLMFISDGDVQPHPVDDYHITDNIPWNQPGARNLGAIMSTTNWMLFTDIDHRISIGNLIALTNLIPLLDKFTIYRFPRRDVLGRYPDQREHGNSFLIHKKAWRKIGGYDEDFCGHYGYDDNFFFHLAGHAGVSVKVLEEIELIVDIYRGTPGLERNALHNKELFRSKCVELQNGTYTHPEGLRFRWVDLNKQNGK